MFSIVEEDIGDRKLQMFYGYNLFYFHTIFWCSYIGTYDGFLNSLSWEQSIKMRKKNMWYEKIWSLAKDSGMWVK